MGDLPGLTEALSAGMHTFAVTGTAQTASADDRLAVKFYVKNLSKVSQSFAYQAGTGTASAITGSATPAPTSSPATKRVCGVRFRLYAQAVLADSPTQYYQFDESSGPSGPKTRRTRKRTEHIPAQYSSRSPDRSAALNSSSIQTVRPPDAGRCGLSKFEGPPRASLIQSKRGCIQPPLPDTQRFGALTEDTVCCSTAPTARFSRSSAETFSLGDAGNTWHHVVFVYDAPAAKATYFIDGEPDASAPISNSAAAFNAPYFAGQYGSTPAYQWNGRLAQIAFYKTALSASRIVAHYQAAGYTAGQVPTPGPAPRRHGIPAAGFPVQWVSLAAQDWRSNPDAAGISMMPTGRNARYSSSSV